MQDGVRGPDPAVQRRRLRNELRKAREEAGLRQLEVAAAMDWSQSKLIRIETGAVNISTNDLKALLGHYRIDRARIDELVELARAARETPRWNQYRSVTTSEFVAFLGYESSASIIRNYEPLVVPGLLQTEEYARAILTVAQSDTERIDKLIDLRSQRQDVLTREPLPDLHFILDESVLHRHVGGTDVAIRQLRHLREMAERPNITIRVVPFNAGYYPRMTVPYVIFEFPDATAESILYVEDRVGGFIIREATPDGQSKSDPVDYLGVFWQLELLAPKEGFKNAVEVALERMTA